MIRPSAKFRLILIILSGILLSACGSKAPEVHNADNSQNEKMLETMVKMIMDQTSTAEYLAVLSATPTFTEVPTSTPAPTLTPIPTETQIPTETLSPEMEDWINRNYPDGYVVQGGSYFRGSTTTSDSDNCNIKGNYESGIYHCKNSPNYDTMVNYRWFCSPSEAEAAGYRAAKTMGGWCQQ